MRIQLNGQPRDLDQPTTVADLVRAIGLDGSPCAVEVNARLSTLLTGQFFFHSLCVADDPLICALAEEG